MPVSAHTIALIEKHGYLPGFRADRLEGLALWITDRENRMVDLTARTASYFQREREALLGRRISELLPPAMQVPELNENALILAGGRPSTQVVWAQLPVGWRKMIVTKCLLADRFVLGVAHDLTDVDPLGEWLLRVDVVKRRLELGARYGGEHLTLAEWLVLHRLARGQTYDEIAEELCIALDTVKYRIRRIKDKLRVESMAELWEEVYSGGLVHLLALPLGLDNLSGSELELLERDPSTWAR